MNKSLNVLAIIILFNLFFTSCRNDEDDVPSPMNPNENELITTIKCIFKEAGNSSNLIEANFKDLDGEGGKPPILDTIKLYSGTIYHVELLLLDESKSSVDTISYEIKEEGEGHQFFFSASAGAELTFTYSDMDKNGVPIGLISTWTTGTATTSQNEKIRIILKHQGENKPVFGLGNINIGSTDIDVNFPVLIQ